MIGFEWLFLEIYSSDILTSGHLKENQSVHILSPYMCQLIVAYQAHLCWWNQQHKRACKKTGNNTAATFKNAFYQNCCRYD